jgi:hypothetical protein
MIIGIIGLIVSIKQTFPGKSLIIEIYGKINVVKRKSSDEKITCYLIQYSWQILTAPSSKYFSTRSEILKEVVFTP